MLLIIYLIAKQVPHPRKERQAITNYKKKKKQNHVLCIFFYLFKIWINSFNPILNFGN